MPHKEPPPINWALADHLHVPLDHPEAFLSEDELTKLSGLRFPKRRREWLLGRWAAKCLAHTISAFREIPLTRIEIGNTPEGAPVFLRPGGISTPGRLSISHSDPYALCAISLEPGFHIGVDLEKIETRSTNFIEDYLTGSEQKLLSACPPQAQTLLVNLIWSTKESMLKALGVGLRQDTRSVEVLQASPDRSEGQWWPVIVRDAGQADRRWFAWWQGCRDFVLTLAGFTENPALDIRSVRLEEKKL